MKYIFGTLILVASWAHAGLHWNTTTADLNASFGKLSSTAIFEFKNTSEDPASIRNVTSPCSCISFVYSTNTIPSKANGMIKATFNFGNREGPQHKRIDVETLDGKTYALYLKADIPRTYKLSSRRLQWGKDRSQKTCRLINQSTNALKLVSSESKNTGFQLKLKEIRAGFEYELEVIPPTGKGSTIIKVIAESIDGHEPKTYTLFAVSK